MGPVLQSPDDFGKLRIDLHRGHTECALVLKHGQSLVQFIAAAGSLWGLLVRTPPLVTATIDCCKIHHVSHAPCVDSIRQKLHRALVRLLFASKGAGHGFGAVQNGRAWARLLTDCNDLKLPQLEPVLRPWSAKGAQP